MMRACRPASIVPHLVVSLLIALAVPVASTAQQDPAGSPPPVASAGVAAGAANVHEGCPFAEPTSGGGASPAPAVTPLHLPGQDAFGAIQEVVALLDADPSTAWRTVDVRALRDHLVDMNELVLNAEVTTTPVPGGFAAEVTGTGRTLGAIRRMLPMHVHMLGLEQSAMRAVWRQTDTGGVLTVTTDRQDGVARLRGLGFYGVMALGDHHRRHHLGIATGRMHP
jgi:hypothetical protein